MFENLTFITITYNDNLGLDKTCASLSDFVNNGATHIIINGGDPILIQPSNNIIVINESDDGRYDALNKGIMFVNTEYFMLVHSGDELICKFDEFSDLLNLMSNNNLDLLLGNQFIEYGPLLRKHTVNLWFPLMFNFGAQPPHLPILYRTNFINGKIIYDLNLPVIADFKYLFELFKLMPTYKKTKIFLIRMSGGGATSSGLKSFFTVSREFINYYGLIRGILFSFLRIPFKIIQIF